ncbi:MAG: N-acetylmuramoyl-L-alanine amidase [Exilispira sp.]|nr:N-acetylmuramoyl-L-alanine amidase [Exilispira sp.]
MRYICIKDKSSFKLLLELFLIFILLFLLFISLLFIFLSSFSQTIIAKDFECFNQKILFDDFKIDIKYDPILDQYIFINLVNNDRLVVDSSGICVYKYTIVSLTSEILIIDNQFVLPDELVFKLYKKFFVPVENNSVYDSWFQDYLSLVSQKAIQSIKDETKIDKNNAKDGIDKENEQNTQDNENSTNDDSAKVDKSNSSNQNTKENQVQKDLNTFYSFAEAKIVDFKVISFIIIDAGHGGTDPGAIKGKVYEKDINLKVALKLKKILQGKFPYLNIYMTRENDSNISLEDRVKFANKYITESQNGIFVSLHSNANPYSSKKSGLEIYYLDYDVVDEKIKDLVKYENKEVGDTFLGTIINRLLNEQLIFESQKLASFLFSAFKSNIKEIPISFVRGAPFYVLAYTEMPSVLIEMGYITNQNDLNAMQSDKFIDSFAISVSSGIEQFIKEYTISEGFKKIQ